MNEEAKQKTQQNEDAEKTFDYLETEDDGSGEIYSIEEKEIMINGRKLRQNEKVYDLIDIIEESSPPPSSSSEEGLSDEMLIKISEMCEKVARQMFPPIAERIIKEEIRKLRESIEDSDE